MSEQLTLQPAKFTSLRSTRSSSSAAWTDNWKQAQNEQHMIQGYHPDKVHRYRSILEFSMSEATFANVAKIISAELHVFRSSDHAGLATQNTPDTNLKLMVKRPPDWAEAGGGEGNWSGALDDDAAEGNATYRAYAQIPTTGIGEKVININSLVHWWAPASIDVGTLGKGKNQPNYGIILVVAGSSPENVKHETVLGSPNHANVGLRPFLVITYEPKGGPGTVSTSAPNGDIDSGIPQFFEGSYSPGRPGDKMVKVEIKRTGGGLPDLSWQYTPNNSEVTSSTFAVPVPASWPLLTSFNWVARVWNSKGEWTPYSAPLAVRWTGTPPALSLAAPAGVTLVSLLSVPFKVRATVPAKQYRAARWRVQLRTRTVSSDPTWADAVLWDTGPMTVPLSATERGPTTATVIQNLSIPFGGPALDPGLYSWRVQAADVYGALSPWLYSDITLTAPYVPQPGDAINLTGYAKLPPHRIRIFGMGALRGPGKLLAELTDAANAGASEYFNAPGEFYFTLPVNHKQVAVIEPYQVHYALEVHTGEGWRGKAFGLITDFDANEDEVVFYGTDYLGLLARSIEERFDPNDAELPTDKGGAKYVTKAISFIISDQLTQAKARANSPVGFITVGDIASIAEKVTIYASFKQRLSFISGLIESARAGTGKRTRLVCERQVNGTFRWRLLADPGLNRDNLRMEYGGLVQGFRTIPFGNWGTAVAATGRTMLGTKVYSTLKTAPGISEAIYGHWPSLAMYADLDDLADLQRRATQAASRTAKVGKQLGIALRVGALGVKDGWDICDSVPVNINAGIVDTTRFGSGYWTIWGWAWSSFPDGHDQLTLSLSPREDSTPPNPDLIESKPILEDWQVGHGVPTSWGEPPTPTP